MNDSTTPHAAPGDPRTYWQTASGNWWRDGRRIPDCMVPDNIQPLTSHVADVGDYEPVPGYFT